LNGYAKRKPRGAARVGADDFLAKPIQEAEPFLKIRAHLGSEYVYTENTATEALVDLPQDLMDQIRESVISADLDQLLAKI
jgi:hypothetical protein